MKAPYILEPMDNLTDEEWDDLCGYLDNALDNWLSNEE